MSLLRALAGREGAQGWDRSPCGTLCVTRRRKPVSCRDEVLDESGSSPPERSPAGARGEGRLVCVQPEASA